MIPKKPAPDLIRGGNRFSEDDHAQTKDMVGNVIQFFHRASNRGEQFRTEYQKMYDEGIAIALKYPGE